MQCLKRQNGCKLVTETQSHQHRCRQRRDSPKWREPPDEAPTPATAHKVLPSSLGSHGGYVPERFSVSYKCVPCKPAWRHKPQMIVKSFFLHECLHGRVNTVEDGHRPFTVQDVQHPDTWHNAGHPWAPAPTPLPMPVAPSDYCDAKDAKCSQGPWDPAGGRRVGTFPQLEAESAVPAGTKTGEVMKLGLLLFTLSPTRRKPGSKA